LPGKTYMGTLIVDATYAEIDQLELVFVEPPADDKSTPTVTQDEADDAKVLEVVGKLTADGHEPSQRTVEAKTSGMSAERIRNALTRLVLDRKLTDRDGPRSARLFDLPTASGDDHG
jgi:hypothetical protein